MPPRSSPNLILQGGSRQILHNLKYRGACANRRHNLTRQSGCKQFQPIGCFMVMSELNILNGNRGA
uniref:Uncharacterized protein n=1 Tax=Mesocestoides corti TaxID=53468 RepID=A0A5K3FHK2_MESCO